MQNFFSIISQLIQLSPGFFRFGEFNQLNLVELMHTNQATGITACSTGFCTEASAVCGIFQRQLIAGQNIITMIVGYRNLCGRNQVHIAVFQLVHILGKFRQLAGALHACTVNDERREEFGITMLSGVYIQEEVDNGTLQTGAHATIEYITCTADLNATFEIQNAQVFTDIPVSLRFKIKFGRFAPGADNRIAAIIFAYGNIFSRNVRNSQQNAFDFFFNLFQFLVICSNFIAESTNCSHLLSSILTGFFQLADLLRCSVAFFLQCFYLLGNFTTLFIQFQEFSQIKAAITAFYSLFDQLRIFADEF